MRTSVLALLSLLPITLDAQAGPAAQRALATPGYTWLTRSSRDVTIHVQAGSAAEARADALVAQVTRVLADDLRWLGERSAKGRLELFFVGSREAMRPLTGGTPGGHSVTSEGTAFFVTNDSVSPALRHEIMHLLSWRLWGTPGGAWLSEGVATHATNGCGPYGIREMTAAIGQAGRLPTLATLRSNFVYAAEEGVLNYIASADIVDRILAQHGRERLRSFWSSGGFGKAEKSLGTSAKEFERAWRSDVQARKPRTAWPTIWAYIRKHGCE